MGRPRTSASSILALLLMCVACGMLRRTTGHSEAPIDLNAAPVRQVEKLPGITPSMARRIVEGRPYGDPSELVSRGILTERELERIMNDVEVKGAH
jgi:DNA uptake protein ComE-like DNA-binding protein